MSDEGNTMIDNFYLSSLIRSKTAYRYGESFLRSGIEHQYPFSLVMFDDAIEIMVSTALNFLHYFPNGKNASLKYFMPLVKRLNEKLESEDRLNEDDLQRLHEGRNAAQHRNQTPSRIDLENFQKITIDTLNRISKTVFSLELDSISQSILIRNELVRGLYKSAEEDYYKQDYEGCVIKCGAAFQLAKSEEISKLYGSFKTIAEIDFNRIKQDASEEVQVVYGIIEKINEEIEVLKLGLEYKKYQIFRGLFGYIIDRWEPDFDNEEDTNPLLAYDSFKEFYKVEIEKQKIIYDKEKAEFCLLFIIDPILKWESVERETLTDFLMKIVEGFSKVFKKMWKDKD